MTRRAPRTFTVAQTLRRPDRRWTLRTRVTRLALLLMLCVCGGARADDGIEPPKLRIGDKAPRLVGLDWVQGKKVNNFKRGTVYVLDFWSDTPHGRIGIQHLNALAERYRDEQLEIIAIGVPIYDQLPDAEEVIAWLGDELSYKIATDPKGRTYEAFHMNAGCLTYFIPVTMVIDGRGKLAWIGHLPRGARRQSTRVLPAAR